MCVLVILCVFAVAESFMAYSRFAQVGNMTGSGGEHDGEHDLAKSCSPSCSPHDSPDPDYKQEGPGYNESS